MDESTVEFGSAILRRHESTLQVHLNNLIVREVPSMKATLDLLASIERSWNPVELEADPGQSPLALSQGAARPTPNRLNRRVVTGVPVRRELPPTDIADEERVLSDRRSEELPGSDSQPEIVNNSSAPSNAESGAMPRTRLAEQIEAEHHSTAASRWIMPFEQHSSISGNTDDLATLEPAQDVQEQSGTYRSSGTETSLPLRERGLTAQDIRPSLVQAHREFKTDDGPLPPDLSSQRPASVIESALSLSRSAGVVPSEQSRVRLYGVSSDPTISPRIAASHGQVSPSMTWPANAPPTSEVVMSVDTPAPQPPEDHSIESVTPGRQALIPEGTGSAQRVALAHVIRPGSGAYKPTDSVVHTPDLDARFSRVESWSAPGPVKAQEPRAPLPDVHSVLLAPAPPGPVSAPARPLRSIAPADTSLHSSESQRGSNAAPSEPSPQISEIAAEVMRRLNRDVALEAERRGITSWDL